MFILQYLAKLFKILRSAATPEQIAGGFILGMIVGLTPFWSLHNLLILFLIIILNVNLAMAIFGWLLFSGIAWLMDPLFHDLGFFILVDMSGLKSIWTSLYNIPVVALSRFNNTIVMGSLVSSILLLLPAYIFTKKFVLVYREKIDPSFQRLKIVQTVKGTKFYQIYEKISDWR